MMGNYQAEVKEKWGKTAAYKEFEAKTKGQSKQKWDALSKEMDSIMAEFALCMKQGESPVSSKAKSLVKNYRAIFRNIIIFVPMRFCWAWDRCMWRMNAFRTTSTSTPPALRPLSLMPSRLIWQRSRFGGEAECGKIYIPQERWVAKMERFS